MESIFKSISKKTKCFYRSHYCNQYEQIYSPGNNMNYAVTTFITLNYRQFYYLTILNRKYYGRNKN